MTLEEAKKIVFDKEDKRLYGDSRIFYPDPMNENDCAQCGKSKQEHHIESDGRAFWCIRHTKKSFYELMDETAELYAHSKNVPAERSSFMREQAICVFELTKVFTGEPTNNAMKTCLEMAGYVMELTNY